MAAAGSRIRLDLNSPEFQEVFLRLEASELKQVVASTSKGFRGANWTNPSTARV